MEYSSKQVAFFFLENTDFDSLEIQILTRWCRGPPKTRTSKSAVPLTRWCNAFQWYFDLQVHGSWDPLHLQVKKHWKALPLQVGGTADSLVHVFGGPLHQQVEQIFLRWLMHSKFPSCAVFSMIWVPQQVGGARWLAEPCVKSISQQVGGARWLADLAHVSNFCEQAVAKFEIKPTQCQATIWRSRSESQTALLEGNGKPWISTLTLVPNCQKETFESKCKPVALTLMEENPRLAEPKLRKPGFIVNREGADCHWKHELGHWKAVTLLDAID